MDDEEREERLRVLEVLLDAYPYGVFGHDMKQAARLPNPQRAIGSLRWLAGRGLAQQSGDRAMWWASQAAKEACDLFLPNYAEGQRLRRKLLEPAS